MPTTQQMTEETNVRRPSLRARDASTASMVNAIRRGSVKISWPIPSSDEDHTLLTAQLPGPVTVSSQTIRAPARPPRDDEGGQAAVAVALGAHAVGLAPASSREHLRQGNVPAKLQGVNSKPLGAGDAGNTSSNQPKRKRGSVRSIIRRFLRRSTVKEGRGSGRLQKSGSEAGRLGHHRSDPIASPLIGDGDGMQKKSQRSTSLPIKELTEIGPSTPRRPGAGDSNAPRDDHAYEQGLDLEGGSSKPWQGMSPGSQFEDDPERSWQGTSPNVARWTGQHDPGLGTTWTGLAPRPASSYARRAGSYSPPLRPEEIGVALPHGASNPRRRSRSAGELKTSYQVGVTQAERRMSEEIRYWRESVLAQPLSPLSNEKANEEVGQSRPISYENGEFDPEPQSTPGDRLSAEFEAAPKDPDVVELRRRVVELEAKVWHLQTAMAKIHRYLTEKHEGDPALPDVLKHTLSRSSGETFSLSPKKTLFPSHRAPAGRRARLPDISSEIGMDIGPSPRASLDRISDSIPSVSHASDTGSPAGLGVIHPTGQAGPEPSEERHLSLSTVTTSATSTTARAEASSRPLTAFLGGRYATMKENPSRQNQLDTEQMGVSDLGSGAETGTRSRPRPPSEASRSSDRRKRGGDVRVSGLNARTSHGNDVDNNDDNDDGDDHDDDEEYTTTSETFITPTEDISFALSASSSSSSFGDKGETTTTGTPPTGTMMPWSTSLTPTTATTTTTAVATTTQPTTGPVPPGFTSTPSLPNEQQIHDLHQPAERNTSEPRRMSLSQLTTNRSVTLVSPSSSSLTAPAPAPSTSF